LLTWVRFQRWNWGAKPRAILTMLGLHNGSVVPADTLIELRWGDQPPRTADKSGFRPLPPGGTKSCGKA
jgi:hypothetical protein